MKDEKSNIKQTQGQKKLLQYLEDIKRNKIFINKFNKIRTILKSKKEDEKEREREIFLDDLMIKYQKYKEELKKQSSLYYSKFDKIYDDLAEEYGIDSELIHFLSLSEIMQKKFLKISAYEDLCSIRDNYDIILNRDFFGDSPIELDQSLITHIKSYPISINIHKFASKRDVLDFIEKRWDIINDLMETYRGKKKIRFRQRKLKRKITDFIWDNKNLDIKEIKNKLDEKFPKNGIIYNDIYKIINLEKRRRLKKLM